MKTIQYIIGILIGVTAIGLLLSIPLTIAVILITSGFGISISVLNAFLIGVGIGLVLATAKNIPKLNINVNDKTPAKTF